MLQHAQTKNPYSENGKIGRYARGHRTGLPQAQVRKELYPRQIFPKAPGYRPEACRERWSLESIPAADLQL